MVCLRGIYTQWWRSCCYGPHATPYLSQRRRQNDALSTYISTQARRWSFWTITRTPRTHTHQIHMKATNFLRHFNEDWAIKQAIPIDDDDYDDARDRPLRRATALKPLSTTRKRENVASQPDTGTPREKKTLDVMTVLLVILWSVGVWEFFTEEAVEYYVLWFFVYLFYRFILIYNSTTGYFQYPHILIYLCNIHYAHEHEPEISGTHNNESENTPIPSFTYR